MLKKTQNNQKKPYFSCDRVWWLLGQALHTAGVGLWCRTIPIQLQVQSKALSLPGSLVPGVAWTENPLQGFHSSKHLGRSLKSASLEGRGCPRSEPTSVAGRGSGLSELLPICSVFLCSDLGYISAESSSCAAHRSQSFLRLLRNTPVLLRNTPLLPRNSSVIPSNTTVIPGALHCFLELYTAFQKYPTAPQEQRSDFQEHHSDSQEHPSASQRPARHIPGSCFPIPGMVLRQGRGAVPLGLWLKGLSLPGPSSAPVLAALCSPCAAAAFRSRSLTIPAFVSPVAIPICQAQLFLPLPVPQ